MAKKKNPFTYKTANEAPGFLLYQVHKIWQRDIKRSLKEFDITHTQFIILASTYWLLLQSEEITQIEIAKHAKMDVMMNSNVLRTLEKKGFIKRKNHKTDTRAKLIDLTKQGKEILKKAVKRVEDFDRNFFSTLEDSKNFNNELQLLMNNDND